MRALVLVICLLATAQTRVHGPTQVRDLAGGGALAWYYAPLDFGTLAAGQCAERWIPAAGASPGQALAPGWPPDLPAGVHGIMYAGANGVVVRLCAVQAAAVSAGRTYSAVLMEWR